MNLDEAKKTLKECSGITRICLVSAIDQVHGLQADAMKKLAELRKELPEALAQRALGKENNVNGIKIEIAKHEETLSDALLTLQELDRLQAVNAKQIKEATTLIEKHQWRVEYDALRDDLRTNSYSEVDIDAKLLELKAIANNVDQYEGIQKDYEQFIAEMQAKYKRYRISRQ